jgi:hypothetical protein
MSTAVLEPIVERSTVAQPARVEVAVAAPGAPAAEKWSDPRPLVPVFVAGAISLALSGIFIGSVLIWLALRHSGVMAP